MARKFKRGQERIPFKRFDPRMLAAVDPCFIEKQDMRKAGAIVGQVLVHFGAGYGQTSTQIFATPYDLAGFYNLLLKSTMRALKDKTLDWDNDQPTRDQICAAAYAHGGLAKTRAAGAPLALAVILDTLREIQATLCPPGSGGGPVCDF